MSTEELKAVVAPDFALIADMLRDHINIFGLARSEGHHISGTYTDEAVLEQATRIEAATAPMSGLSGDEREALESFDDEELDAISAVLRMGGVAANIRTLCATVRRLATAPADSLGVVAWAHEVSWVNGNVSTSLSRKEPKPLGDYPEGIPSDFTAQRIYPLYALQERQP